MVPGAGEFGMMESDWTPELVRVLLGLPDDRSDWLVPVAGKYSFSPRGTEDMARAEADRFIRRKAFVPQVSLWNLTRTPARGDIVTVCGLWCLVESAEPAEEQCAWVIRVWVRESECAW